MKTPVPQANFAKFTVRHLRQSLYSNKVAGLRPGQTLAQVFSCEFSKISKNTFFTEHLWATVSEKPGYIL